MHNDLFLKNFLSKKALTELCFFRYINIERKILMMDHMTDGNGLTMWSMILEKPTVWAHNNSSDGFCIFIT